MLRFDELKFLERTGVISNLRRQVQYKLILPDGTPVAIRSDRFPNGRVCTYTADAVYVDNATGEEIVEDTKTPGTLTNESKLRMAIFEAIYKKKVVVYMVDGRRQGTTARGYSNGGRKTSRAAKAP